MIRRPGVKDRARHRMDTVLNSAVRRVLFVVPAVTGAAAIALAVAACGQNVPRITSAADGSGPTPVSSAAGSSRPTPVSSTNGGTRPATGSANIGGAACPTQGVGGEGSPPLCAPPSASSRSPGRIASTIRITRQPPPTSTPSSCSVPTVTGVSPSQGSASGGDTVTITGTGFGGGAEVFFGGAPAQSAIPESDTEIIAPARQSSQASPPVNITVSCDGIVSPAVAVDSSATVRRRPLPRQSRRHRPRRFLRARRVGR